MALEHFEHWIPKRGMAYVPGSARPCGRMPIVPPRPSRSLTASFEKSHSDRCIGRSSAEESRINIASIVPALNFPGAMDHLSVVKTGCQAGIGGDA